MCLTLATPWTTAYQAPLSMVFPRQEYCSGLPFPSPRDLPDPGIELASLVSPCLGRWFLYHWATWEAQYDACVCTNSTADLKELKGSELFKLNLPLPESPRVELLGLQSADKWKRKIQALKLSPGLEEVWEIRGCIWDLLSLRCRIPHREIQPHFSCSM